MSITRLGTNAIISVPSSAITALPAGVGGKVVQVVIGTTEASGTTTSATFASTGLSASITPSSTSIKFL